MRSLPSPNRPPPRIFTLDRLLTFDLHIQSISTKAAARCRVLASLTSKLRVWRKGQLIKIYKALQLRLLAYGAMAWQH